MPTKATASGRGKPPTHARDPLFEFASTPAHRDPSVATGKSAKPVQHKSAQALLADANPLMTFANAPKLPMAKKPAEQGREGATVLPDWAIARPPLQSILEYTDQFGTRQRQHVVGQKRIDHQDIELRLEIEDILKAGGSNIRLDVLSVATGLTLTRWAVWRAADGGLDCRLICTADRYLDPADVDLRKVA
jgi:hypothetical protein